MEVSIVKSPRNDININIYIYTYINDGIFIYELKSIDDSRMVYVLNMPWWNQYKVVPPVMFVAGLSNPLQSL